MANASGILFMLFFASAINGMLFHHTGIGALLLFSYIGFTGAVIGARAFGDDRAPAVRVIGGSLLVIASLAVLGSLMYYTLPVTLPGLLALLAIPGISAAIFASRHPAPFPWPRLSLPSALTWDHGLIAFGVVSILAWWWGTLPLTITDAVRSPWLIVSPASLLALVSAAACAIVLVVKRHTASIPLLAATFFSGITLAVFLYPLGYGFDPFLHRATVAHITEFGTITPKPLYYIGEYALELFAHRVWSVPLFWADVLLVPVIATLTAWFSASVWQEKTRALALIVFPLGLAIATTPQSLGYCLFFATLIAAYHAPTRWPALLFALAALLTHPLAGIPATLFLVLHEISRISHAALRRTLLTLCTAGGAIAMPVVFALQAKLAGLPTGFSLAGLANVANLPLTGFLANHFHTWKDGVYLFISNQLWIVLVIAAFGMALARRESDRWYAPALVALALGCNFVLLALTFDFSYLISYERTDFSLRLLILAQLCLLPYVGIALGKAIAATRRHPALFLSTVGVLACVFGANVYGAYPRHDNYARSSGFNVGQADIDAAHAIHAASPKGTYVVLANQTVSAAAVETFGFETYFHGDIFYYPIPTGGPLYDIYLAMVEEAPTRTRAEAAMDLTGVSTAYFVVNDYWWQSDRIIETAKREADSWVTLHDGKITIFTFTR